MAAEVNKKSDKYAFDPTTTNSLAMLRLGDTITTTATAGDYQVPVMFTDPCSDCGRMKRQSPTTIFDYQPRTKKIFIEPTTSVNHSSILTFPQLPEKNDDVIPVTPSEKPHSLLRSFSDPITFSTTPSSTTYTAPSYPVSFTRSNTLSNTNSPEKSKIDVPANNTANPFYRIDSFSGSSNTSQNNKTEINPAMAMLPPRPLSLCRSFSDPTPSAIQTVGQDFSRHAKINEPTKLEQAKNSFRSSSSGETVTDTSGGRSNSTKRWKRVETFLTEMHKQLNDIMSEVQEEEEKYKITTSNKETCETEKTGGGDGVRIERDGEGLSIHYNCTCGKTYHVHMI